MPYPIEVDTKIGLGTLEGNPFTYEEGLEIADKVQQYLKENNAVLITGCGELSRSMIQAYNNAGDWVYHLKDTTLFSEIRPFDSLHKQKTLMRVVFATAGRNEREVLYDLQQILDQHDYSERKKLCITPLF